MAEAYFFLADVFIGKEKELRSEVEGAPGGWSGWRRMKVVSKVKESPLHTSLVFAPEDGSELLDYQPGQYLSVRVESQQVPGGGEFSHCRNYSLSDSPRTDGYRITVKREKGGTVSSYLHHAIKPGDTIEVGVPCGDFVLQPGSSCVLLGAGVGITPLLTMMKVAAKSDLQTTLIYRASDASSHPFREEIESVMSQGGVTVHWMYSDDKVSSLLSSHSFLVINNIHLRTRQPNTTPPTWSGSSQTRPARFTSAGQAASSLTLSSFSQRLEWRMKTSFTSTSVPMLDPNICTNSQPLDFILWIYSSLSLLYC